MINSPTAITLLRIDDGIDLNGNGSVDFTTPGNVSYGFEDFLTFKQPGYFETSGDGLFTQTIDATTLSEGQHFIEVRAFRHREPGEGDAVYSPFKKSIYVDRLAPVSEIVSFDPIVDGVNEERRLNIGSVDLTANNVHAFLDLPASLTDSQIISMVGAGSQTNQVDRDLFERDFDNIHSGNHVATVVTFEQTGNVNVQRFPGLFTSTIFGAGLGDLDFDGDVDANDFSVFATVLQSSGNQFNPAGDFNADGLVDIQDLPLYHQQLLANSANTGTLSAFDTMVISNAAVDYGDAGGSYATLQSSGGPHHILHVGPFLGLAADADTDGQPTSNSDGDDNDGTNDEDGVTLPTKLFRGETLSISVDASDNGFLNAFIDLNLDGDFFDASEHFATDLALTGGTNSVSLVVPTSAEEGNSVVRFRFSSYVGFGPTELASDGEVEDYAVEISNNVANRGVSYAGSTAAAYGPDALASKQALRPGEIATQANFTNYHRGLNRVVVEIAHLPVAILTDDDFEFRVGNTDDPSSWQVVDGTNGISLPAIAVLPTADSRISSVQLTWPDNEIENSWLQVTVKANANTELDADDVFYFGNQVGDVNGDTNIDGRVRVNSFDTGLTRLNQSPTIDVGIDNAYDVDRNGLVNSFDTGRIRLNQSLGGLLLFTAPVGSSPPVSPPSFTSISSFRIEPITSTDYQRGFVDRLLNRYEANFSESTSVERRRELTLRRLRKIAARLAGSVDQFAGNQRRVTNRTQLALVLQTIVEQIEANPDRDVAEVVEPWR